MLLLFGFTVTSRGDFKFEDSLISETSFLLAVAVSSTNVTEGNVAHKIASLE